MQDMVGDLLSFGSPNDTKEHIVPAHHATDAGSTATAVPLGDLLDFDLDTGDLVMDTNQPITIPDIDEVEDPTENDDDDNDGINDARLYEIDLVSQAGTNISDPGGGWGLAEGIHKEGNEEEEKEEEEDKTFLLSGRRRRRLSSSREERRGTGGEERGEENALIFSLFFSF